MVPPVRAPSPQSAESKVPEEIIFDKAEEKASIEELPEEQRRLQEEIDGLEEAARVANPERSAEFEAEIERARARIEEISATLEQESEQKPTRSKA